jgi:hypothetical protein
MSPRGLDLVIDELEEKKERIFRYYVKNRPEPTNAGHYRSGPYGQRWLRPPAPCGIVLALPRNSAGLHAVYFIAPPYVDAGGQHRADVAGISPSRRRGAAPRDVGTDLRSAGAGGAQASPSPQVVRWPAQAAVQPRPRRIAGSDRPGAASHPHLPGRQRGGDSKRRSRRRRRLRRLPHPVAPSARNHRRSERTASQPRVLTTVASRPSALGLTLFLFSGR